MMIFKKDSKGKVRFWDAEVAGAEYRFKTGIVGGTVNTSAWRVAAPKNVGRANATSAEEQAVIEVAAKREKKLRQDYHETQDTIDEEKMFKPMKATKFVERKDSLDWSRPMGSQPKLDGIRMVPLTAGPHSRDGVPIVTVDHIRRALAPIAERYPHVVLDGELYNHKLRKNFQTIASLVNRKKITDEQRREVESTVEYHIYDVAQGVGGTFEERHAFLRMLEIEGLVGGGGLLRVVPYTPVSGEAGVMDAFAAHQAEGYEGSMVRLLDVGYEKGKESPSLMKLKPYDDAEFEVLGFQDAKGAWAGTAKKAIVRLEDGREAVATMKGEHAYLKGIWENQQAWIGKQATVRYEGFTDEGNLRFPTVQAIHENDRL